MGQELAPEESAQDLVSEVLVKAVAVSQIGPLSMDVSRWWVGGWGWGLSQPAPRGVPGSATRSKCTAFSPSKAIEKCGVESVLSI